MTIRIHPIASDFEVILKADRAPLAPDLEATVQALWNEEMANRGIMLTDGRIFSIENFSSNRTAGTFVEYRLLVAQRRRPDLYQDLLVQPLAVCGLIESPDGLVFGRRAIDLATEANKWELLPAGGLDPQACQIGTSVDYMRQFYRELLEEAGVGLADIHSPKPLILLEDTSTHVFDLAIGACTRLHAAEIIELFERNNAREYSELMFVPLSGVQSFISANAKDIVAVTVALLEYRLHASGGQGKVLGIDQ